MKLHSERPDIQRSGVDAETEFTIKTTSKAFDILSTGIYANNVAAIVRELSCNAYDAHVAAGKKDIPFEVHLPNALEPFFSVKDYGTGLSDEQVMTLYTTYFDSTKTDSNDFIGALGLGSKSPFSYTKAFEVISRFDGVRQVYSVFINEDGIPSIARIGKPIATDEVNGLEVKLTVDRSDFYDFEYNAANVLRWFTPRPIIQGNASFTFAELPEAQLSGDGWYVVRTQYGDGALSAVQGNVEYRVDVDQLVDVLRPEFRTFLHNTQLITFFDIGDLEVAASREEIRYNKRTKENLAGKINQAITAVVETIEKQIDDIGDSAWKAFIDLDKISAKMFRSPEIMKKFVASSKHPLLVQYANQGGKFPPLHIKARAHHIFRYYKKSPHQKQLSRVDMREQSIRPKDYTAVVINDVPAGGIGRLTNWLHENRNKYDDAIVIVQQQDPKRIIVDEDDPLKVKQVVAMTKQEVQCELTDIIDHLGNPDVVRTSELALPSTRRTARLKPVFRYEDYNRHSYRASTVVWKRVDDLDFERGGLYFNLHRGSSIVNGNTAITWPAAYVKMNLEHIVEIINEFVPGANYDINSIIGVGSGDLKRFDKHASWVNLFDVFEEIISQHYHDAAIMHDRWERLPNVNGIKMMIDDRSFMKRVDQLDDDSPFKNIVKMYRQIYDTKTNSSAPHVQFVKEYDRVYGKRKFVVDRKPLVEEDVIIKHYPMLRLTPRFSSVDREDFKIMFDYISAIDRSEK